MFSKYKKGNRVLSTITALTLCATAAALSPAHASEPDSLGPSEITQIPTSDLPEMVAPDSVTQLSDGSVEIEFDDTTYISSFDAETKTITVSTTDDSIEPVTINASLVAPDEVTTDSGPSIAPMASIGGVGCSMVLWFLGMISSAGWEVAVAAIGMGLAGTAVLAVVMSIGTGGLMTWASSHC